MGTTDQPKPGFGDLPLSRPKRGRKRLGSSLGAQDGGQESGQPRAHEVASGPSRLLYHVVFSTKAQAPLLNALMRERLFPYIAAILRNQGGDTVAINGQADHVHLLCQLPPTLAVGEVVLRVKTGAANWIRKTFSYPGFEWQESYLVFSVSPSQLPKVADYVARQKEQHEKMDFLQECRQLLERHEVTYDEEAGRK